MALNLVRAIAPEYVTQNLVGVLRDLRMVLPSAADFNSDEFHQRLIPVIIVVATQPNHCIVDSFLKELLE
jgi:hypothetical protein